MMFTVKGGMLFCCYSGWYDVPEGLVFSYPVMMSTKGYWTVMQDMDLTNETKKKLQEAIKVSDSLHN